MDKRLFLYSQLNYIYSCIKSEMNHGFNDINVKPNEYYEKIFDDILKICNETNRLIKEMD